MKSRCLFAVTWCGFVGIVHAAVLLVGPTPTVLEPEVLRVIDGARRRLWVAMYRLTSGPCVRALCSAQQRGVQVQIILDREMTLLPVHRVLMRKLKKAGVTVLWGQRDRMFHHKWALCDNTVMVGSANWTRAGLARNHETIALMQEPSLVQSFATHFVTLKKRTQKAAVMTPRSTHSVFFVPDHAAAMRQELTAALACAQKTIEVRMYALTAGWCIDALCSAARRGVMVSVLLEPSQCVDAGIAARLKEAGVAVALYKTPYPGAVLHDKYVGIDGSVWLGSMNWTGPGTRANDEVFVRVPDATP